MSNLPQETTDRIKANSISYMHSIIKGMVGDDELQPSHLSYAHEAGALTEAERAQGLVDALEAITGKTMPVPNKADMIDIATAALAKYREVNK